MACVWIVWNSVTPLLIFHLPWLDFSNNKTLSIPPRPLQLPAVASRACLKSYKHRVHPVSIIPSQCHCFHPEGLAWPVCRRLLGASPLPLPAEAAGVSQTDDAWLRPREESAEPSRTISKAGHGFWQWVPVWSQGNLYWNSAVSGTALIVDSIRNPGILRKMG